MTTPLENMIREVIREEIRRLIRPDALAANDDAPAPEDLELLEKAHEVAKRFRRVRCG